MTLKVRSLEQILEEISQIDSDLHSRLINSYRSGGVSELEVQMVKELKDMGFNERAIEAMVKQLGGGAHGNKR